VVVEKTLSFPSPEEGVLLGTQATSSITVSKVLEKEKDIFFIAVISI
jgi:hypothetical protein